MQPERFGRMSMQVSAMFHARFSANSNLPEERLLIQDGFSGAIPLIILLDALRQVQREPRIPVHGLLWLLCIITVFAKEIAK